jgi:hypothetical protein
MNISQLHIFSEQVKILIEQNITLDEKNSFLNALITKHEDTIKSLLKEQDMQKQQYELNIQSYLKQIEELNNEIESLKKSNSEKSSKTIWQTTQLKIKEKDELIEELTKTIKFLERTRGVSKNTEDNNFQKEQVNKEILVEKEEVKDTTVKEKVKDTTVTEKVKDTTVNKEKVKETLVKETSVKDTPVKETSVKDTAVKETFVNKEKVKETSVKKQPVKKNKPAPPIVVKQTIEELELELELFGYN